MKDFTKGDKAYNAIMKAHQGWSRYMTHDNGSRSFCVYVSSKTKKANPNPKVDVYKASKEGFSEKEYGKPHTYDLRSIAKIYRIPVGSYQPERVFVGRSPKNPMTSYSGGYGRRFYGNSLLLAMDTAKGIYLFIGERIFSFQSEAPITKFLSPVGNNDVPYPYAIDRKGNYYLMIENVVLPISKKALLENSDPYGGYYYKIKEAMGESLGIEKFTVGKERFNFTSTVDPGTDYDRLTKDFGTPVRLKFKGEKRAKSVTKDEYVKIIKDYNESCGIHAIKEIQEIHKRD